MNGETCDGKRHGEIVNFGLRRSDDVWTMCGQPPTCQVASGCAHEHVIVWDACADCARRALEQVRRKAGTRCCRCGRGGRGQPHECPVIIQVRELACAASRTY